MKQNKCFIFSNTQIYDFYAKAQNVLKLFFQSWCKVRCCFSCFVYAYVQCLYFYSMFENVIVFIFVSKARVRKSFKQ